ncbi:IS21 family transposase [Lysinibacillus telephonicus]|uniref:IS21 family transposase n=1 Tax=Lysinibacillus telephonicus TaxID=1714840 RepID=A0A431UAM7_9BACI|nr:IS21 family transposase [Lysinibacillus telephonicus]
MEEKLVLYIDIHRLHERKLRISQIARQLKVSRNTVYKYLNMTFEEAVEEFGTIERKKKLDPYRDWVVNWLQENPSMSGAQMLDWLQEKFPTIEVGESTVRRYVNEMREIYQIEKTAEPREYEAVVEQPPGKQMQVDWGQTIQKTTQKKEVKLYFIAFVLAHSRQKYMEWQDRPFTTRDTIRCHENAFRYFEGMPEEIVYDQDNLIAVSENAGDLILTKEFQQYVNERKFKIYLCRKADPESKGKIENVVKYVKKNFAIHRVFSTIEDWNEKAWKWLERTGNFKVHQTTKKRPFEVFLLEKQHLRKTSSTLSFSESNPTEIITRNVNKDNTIRFESNRYSVPIGTYTKCPQVKLQINGQQLIIVESTSGEILAKHTISLEKGRLIKNPNHARDRSRTIDTLKQHVLTLFPSTEESRQFTEEICHTYGRYRRDQLLLLQKVAEENPEWISTALKKCMREKLYSANAFRDIVDYLKRQQPEPILDILVDSTKSVSIPVETRDLKAYVQRMGGKVNE